MILPFGGPRYCASSTAHAGKGAFSYGYNLAAWASYARNKLASASRICRLNGALKVQVAGAQRQSGREGDLDYDP